MLAFVLFPLLLSGAGVVNICACRVLQCWLFCCSRLSCGCRCPRRALLTYVFVVFCNVACCTVPGCCAAGVVQGGRRSHMCLSCSAMLAFLFSAVLWLLLSGAGPPLTYVLVVVCNAGFSAVAGRLAAPVVRGGRSCHMLPSCLIMLAFCCSRLFRDCCCFRGGHR